MSLNDTSRREFLRRAAVLSGSVGAAGAAVGAQPGRARLRRGAAASDYKAIVCLFLFGGNDSANMVLPTDAASWNAYQTVRTQQPDPIALRSAGHAGRQRRRSGNSPPRWAACCRSCPVHHAAPRQRTAAALHCTRR